MRWNLPLSLPLGTGFWGQSTVPSILLLLRKSWTLGMPLLPLLWPQLELPRAQELNALVVVTLQASLLLSATEAALPSWCFQDWFSALKFEWFGVFSLWSLDNNILSTIPWLSLCGHALPDSSSKQAPPGLGSFLLKPEGQIGHFLNYFLQRCNLNAESLQELR